MKKICLTLTFLLLLFSFCLTFASCHEQEDALKNPIDFGKTYQSLSNDEESSYVFYTNNVGVFTYRYEYKSTVSSNYDHTTSGTIEFVWKEASDGAVHIFAVNTKYHDDHTKGALPILSAPIYFSEDFFISERGNQYCYYIKEGSELETLIKD